MKDIISLVVYFCGGRKVVLQTALLASVCILTVLMLMYQEQILLWMVERQTGVHISHKEFVEAKEKHRSRCDVGIEIAGHCFVMGRTLIPIGEPKK